MGPLGDGAEGIEEPSLSIDVVLRAPYHGRSAAARTSSIAFLTLADLEMQEGTPARPGSVAVIGAGAVGTALVQRLAATGHRVGAVLSRDAADAQAVAQRAGVPVSGAELGLLPDDIDFVFVCVPDDEISGVAASLAAVDRPWSRTIVAHTSGAKRASELGPLADAGASVLSFHPLQTFTSETSPDAFDGIAVGIEGPEDAIPAGTSMARALGARPVELTAQGKALYHSAAAVASNGLVAMMAVVEELLSAAEIDPSEGRPIDLVAPLVEQSWQNVVSNSPEDVITGPVARGDEGTLGTHLDALEDRAPHLLPLYAALSTEMARTAVRGGMLDADTAERILQRLQTAMTDSSNGENPIEPSR